VRGDLIVSVSGSGNIDVANEVRLTFGSSGRIDEIYVEQGDEVSKGEALAKLDTGHLELALAQAQLTLDNAEYNLKQLKKRLSLTSDRVELAQSQVDVAELGVDEARKQLERASITAPFDGIVASVGADEGDTVSAQNIIIYLINPDSMELKAGIHEIDIPSVEPGQRATISIDALTSLQVEGHVSSICPVPTVQTGLVTYEVTINLDLPEDSEVKVGMSAIADIIIDKRTEVLLIPNQAITQDSEGNPVVETLIKGQVQERTVVIGISDGIQTEIIDGLSEGETVVIELRTNTKPAGPGGLFFGG
jgi:HlyD family secretion protein